MRSCACACACNYAIVYVFHFNQLLEEVREMAHKLLICGGLVTGSVTAVTNLLDAITAGTVVTLSTDLLKFEDTVPLPELKLKLLGKDQTSLVFYSHILLL